MTHIIIGGGPAATNAMETIRQNDGDGNITRSSDEPAGEERHHQPAETLRLLCVGVSGEAELGATDVHELLQRKCPGMTIPRIAAQRTRRPRSGIPYRSHEVPR